jgi:hypothetical protein
MIRNVLARRSVRNQGLDETTKSMKDTKLCALRVLRVEKSCQENTLPWICMPVVVAGVTLFFAGCGKNPHRLAPVSGKVTMDGNPLANAAVAFLPDTKPGAKPSPTSRGQTDKDGRYTLTSSEERPGAVVGVSKVRISTMRSTGGSEGEGGAILARETVPERYNARTELTFEVPEEGTDQANFDLQSK